LAQPSRTAATFSAIHLQRPDRGDDDGGGRLQAGLAALDVEELFRAEIGAEAGLRHHVIGKLQRSARRHDRVAAMGDVGEGAAMDEGGVVLQRLDEVGLHRLLEQHRHGAVGLQVASEDRRPVAPVADDDVAEPALEVL
jgi:hypothetical protein